MPNPKRKHTPSRRDSRRASNWTVKARNSSKCPQCGAAKLPHHICPSCGFYNGELISPKKVKKKNMEGQQPPEEKK
jgi:large subunit ribosomal protein L32